MNLEEARNCIGCTVETDHAGYKMVRSLGWHGPYILKQVTKAGLCILEGYEAHRVRPTQIRYYDWFAKALQRTVDAGICRHYTDKELEGLCAPMAREILAEIDRRAVAILLSQCQR